MVHLQVRYSIYISSVVFDQQVISAANLPDDCINLGQGYMNFGPAEWLVDAAEEALHAIASNHYSHPKGRIRLREAIKQFYGPQLGRDLDVESEILVSSGANQGILFCLTIREPFHVHPTGQYSVFTAFLEQGDEVIMFEPYFDQYLPSVTFNDGTPVYVPLHPPLPSIQKPSSNDWIIDFEELRYE